MKTNKNIKALILIMGILLGIVISIGGFNKLPENKEKVNVEVEPNMSQNFGLKFISKL
jgi:hypothetical protein